MSDQGAWPEIIHLNPIPNVWIENNKAKITKNIDVVFTVGTDPSITNENIILAPNEIVTFTNITATEVT